MTVARMAPFLTSMHKASFRRRPQSSPVRCAVPLSQTPIALNSRHSSTRFLPTINRSSRSFSAQLATAYGGHISEQCFFLLVGKGSNGKSTFLSTLQNVFGDYAVTTPAQTLMVDRYGNQQTNDLAKLVGIRFVAATETEKGQRLAESKIKRITGGDRIACRELYGHLFEYVPQFKLWLATNDPPEFSSSDESIARRIRVIEFPVTFDETAQDQQLSARLLSEVSGYRIGPSRATPNGSGKG